MANGESSTSPSNETVSLKLPSGELVDAVVPPGLSDDQVRVLIRMKRPDLISPPPAAQGIPQGLQGAPLQQRFPIVPQQGEDFSQTMQRAAQAGKTVTPEELQGQAIQGAKMAPAVLAGAGAMGAVGAAALAGPGEVPNAVNAAATAALPHVKALGQWAIENPRLAKALVEVIKGSSIGAGYAGMKKILDIATGSK